MRHAGGHDRLHGRMEGVHRPGEPPVGPRRGQPGRAATLFEELPTRDGREWFGLARARTTLAAAAGRGGSGTSASLEPSLADHAMNDLRRAAAEGYRSPAVFRYEPALAPLRGCDDFQFLMMELSMLANPFAAAH